MKRSQLGVWLLILVLATTLALSGCGKTGTSTSAAPEVKKPAYPEKAVEIVAPAGAGGGWDTFARAIAKTMADEKIVTQPLPVLNKAGGSGAVALAWLVSNHKADPYELIVYSPPLIINGVNGTSKQTFRDLTPLARVISDYNVIVVKNDSPYKTLKDLLEAMKKDPTKISIGGGSAPGGMDHLAFAKIAMAAGIKPKDIKYVSFQGGGEAMASLLGGHLTAISTGVGESIAQIEAKTVRALAITSEKRLGGSLASVPTVKESGFDVSYQIWRGVFGPPEMPAEAVRFWKEALGKMVKTKGWEAVLKNYQWSDAFDADKFSEFLAQEEGVYKKLLTELGFVK